MGHFAVQSIANTSSYSISLSRIKIEATLQHHGLSCIPLSSSKPYSGVSLRSLGYMQRSLFKGNRCEGNRASKTAAVEEGGKNVEEALNELVKEADEGLSDQKTDTDDVVALREALAAAHDRIASAENEKADALKALAQAEAKVQEYADIVVKGTESALQEMQAAKESFHMELQHILEQKLAVESELVLAKQDALELAVSVDKVADYVIKETTAHIAEDAMLKMAAAKTAAAEAALTVEERIKDATLEAANSMIEETRDAIEKSFAALEAAKDKAQKSEIALFQKMQILDDMVLKEASALGLQQAVSNLQRQLQAAENEIQRLETEVKATLARAEAAEARAAAADESLKQFQEKACQSAQEHEESARKALEALKNAGAARLEAARSAFKSDIEALQTALNTVHKAEKSQEKAYARRYQALERALAASEALSITWKERALAVEKLLQRFRTEGSDAAGGNGGIEGVLTGGRMKALLGNDSRKWDLLANGPRRDTPEWMERRIEVALQGLPPRKHGQVQQEADEKFLLPGIEDVWCIATAKVKEDVYTQHAAEKEAIDEQRRVLEKTLSKRSARRPLKASESGTGSGYEIVLQGFNWESWRKKWYLELGPKAADISSCGITTIWFPPPTESVSPQGYMPGDLYNLNSAYGTEDELKNCVEEMHNHDLLVLGDVVLNHRCAQRKGPTGVWNVFGGKLAWGPEAIVRDDPNFHGRGNPSRDFFHAAPNIDHSQDFVRKDIVGWMKWLRTEIGFDGWRLDFVRGFWGGYVKEYIEATAPVFAIGEYWDSLAYEGGNVCYNQDAHRQRIVNWVNATGGTSSAFDVTTKGILHAALHNEYWRLIDPQGKPPGVMGWWPSRAVTFLENHDTGSTQGHWPFPRDKLMQGYAYILTHPGTPVIFYDHFYDFGLRDAITELIAVRRRTGVHCRSTVKIYHATNQGYVAQIGENLVMKLGHLDWNPSKQNNLEGNWQRCLDSGADYQIWERN
ncbi:hypothetical protein KP509_11G067000 [Ceratopteris richardii]|uniref:alpha-amylase n=1 Tax=Ceratopteris richardii TaxID=49495 RepID=A0A8T2TWF6_CERRI|nr:hypothetical protein KP509_11G067000 [Ceratopteris richardii]